MTVWQIRSSLPTWVCIAKRVLLILQVFGKRSLRCILKLLYHLDRLRTDRNEWNLECHNCQGTGLVRCGELLLGLRAIFILLVVQAWVGCSEGIFFARTDIHYPVRNRDPKVFANHWNPLEGSGTLHWQYFWRPLSRWCSQPRDRRVTFAHIIVLFPHGFSSLSFIFLICLLDFTIMLVID